MPTGRDTVSLPIFPLNVVLFPGMRMSLHVFEEQYRRLIRECVDRDTGFATTLMRPDQDGDSHAEPAVVGTLARVIQCTPFIDGRLNVTAVGVSRVTLLSYRHTGQFLVGQFRFLPDIEDPVPVPLVDEARALGSELWSLVTPHQSHPVLPPTHEALSYWIASHLPLSLPAQQELIELRSTRARLAKEISILRTLIDSFRAEKSG